MKTCNAGLFFVEADRTLTTMLKLNSSFMIMYSSYRENVSEV